MEGLELTCFEIISAVGNARSDYIEAIRTARNGDIEKACSLIQEGKAEYSRGHEAHMKLLTKEASDEEENVAVTILLVHAEDLLMSAEDFGILAEEFIETYKMMGKTD